MGNLADGGRLHGRSSRGGKDSYSVMRALRPVAGSGRGRRRRVHLRHRRRALKDRCGRGRRARRRDESPPRRRSSPRGVNSLLCERRATPPEALPMAVGIKQVFRLPASQIENASSCPRARARRCCSSATARTGNVSGCELPVHEQGLHLARPRGNRLHDHGRLEPLPGVPDARISNHPAVAPVIRGAARRALRPHGARGQLRHGPKYVFDGCLVAGESADLCMNMGYQVRGMDFAVASGQMAARRPCAQRSTRAHEQRGARLLRRGDGRAPSSSRGTHLLSGVVMEGWRPHVHQYRPWRDVFNAMFSVDGSPEAADEAHDAHSQAARPYFKLAGEVRKAVKSL